MSHFTKISTSLIKQDLLIKTIDDYKISWFKQKIIVDNYQKHNCFCSIILKQRNNYPINFLKTDESYELIYDEMFWSLSISASLFYEKITTDYALNLVTNNLFENGFKIKNITKENEYGNVKIKINALRFN